MKYYLVDLENTGGRAWFDQINGKRSEMRIYLYYTDTAPCVPWGFIFDYFVELIANGYDVRGVRCYTGKNGLDFQLICQLGQFTKSDQKKRREYIIVSNDGGYDPAIRMLKDQGYNVRRVGTVRGERS